LKKILFISLAVILALSMGLIGCEGEGEGEGEGEEIPYKNDGIFVQQTIGDVDSLDPHWSYDTASGEQLQYLYDTLLWYDGADTDAFVPRLATEWDTVNATQIKFRIRTGVTFVEGGTLTPDDVEYSFERAMVLDRAGGPCWMFCYPLLGYYHTRDGAGVIRPDIGDVIDAAVEVDGEWVVFNLAWEFPMEQFRKILCSNWGSIIDKEWCIANGEWDPAADPLSGTGWHAYNNLPKEDSYLYDHANGTSRWKLDEWLPGIEMTLSENTGYWGTEAVPFDFVVTQVVDEWTSRKLALLNGDADFIYVPRQYIGELEDVTDLNKYQDLGELALTGLFFNFNIDPDSTYIGSGALDGDGIPVDFFADLDVRKAFSYAFNYETFFNDIWLGEATEVGSPVIKGLLGYDAGHAKYSHCLTAAISHLQTAWNGTAWTNGFKFTVCYNTGNDQRQAGCEILADVFANLGLDEFDDGTHFQIAVQSVPWPSFLDQCFYSVDPGVHQGPIPIFCIGWGADYPDTDNFVSPFMYSEGDFAWAQGYGYPSLDAKIEAAQVETDVPAREAMYDEIAGIFHDDAPSVLLGQPLGRRFFTKYISGFYFNPIIPGDAGPLWDMSKSAS
jgi:peptide/nickel transport system substrate-binding protein